MKPKPKKPAAKKKPKVKRCLAAQLKNALKNHKPNGLFPCQAFSDVAVDWGVPRDPKPSEDIVVRLPFTTSKQSAYRIASAHLGRRTRSL